MKGTPAIRVILEVECKMCYGMAHWTATGGNKRLQAVTILSMFPILEILEAWVMALVMLNTKISVPQEVLILSILGVDHHLMYNIQRD